MRACAASSSRQLAAILQELVDSSQAAANSTGAASGLPLAKLIPVVSAAGRQLLEARSAQGDLGELPAVHRLCADAYSSGPPL